MVSARAGGGGQIPRSTASVSGSLFPDAGDCLRHSASIPIEYSVCQRVCSSFPCPVHGLKIWTTASQLIYRQPRRNSTSLIVRVSIDSRRIVRFEAGKLLPLTFPASIRVVFSVCALYRRQRLAAKP
jgi:hypothetical protein